MEKELFDKMIESAKDNSLFDFIANNYWKMDKEELKNIAQELAYVYSSDKSSDVLIANLKDCIDMDEPIMEDGIDKIFMDGNNVSLDTYEIERKKSNDGTDIISVKLDEDCEFDLTPEEFLEFVDEVDDIRISSYSGKLMQDGMTDEQSFYCNTQEFKEAMDSIYGSHSWRSTDNGEEGIYNGYYEALSDTGEWIDTGIYFTEWYEGATKDEKINLIDEIQKRHKEQEKTPLKDVISQEER